MIDHFDDPIHDSNYFSLMAVCDAIKRYTNHKVLICGEGAAEIFGGYERYMKFSKQYKKNYFNNLIYSYNHVAIPRLKLITKDPVIISQRRYEIFLWMYIHPWWIFFVKLTFLRIDYLLLIMNLKFS